MIAMPDVSAFQILRWRTGGTHNVGGGSATSSTRPASRTTGDPRLVMRKPPSAQRG
jgi:hypothetical protein